MHKLLERQLKRYHAGGDVAPEDWQGFVAAVNDAYRQSDHDRTLLERSLDLTSQELLARNEDLRHEYVSERRLLEEQLRQSQKMEAIGLLAGGVAHDFNNMLAVIFTHTDQLLDLTATHDPRHRALEDIRRASERAARLTRQLLAFSRRQILKPQIVSMSAVVRNFESMLRRLLGEKIDLAVLSASDLHPVRADVGQLEQVLMNLVVNARDAMPEGGRILIEARNVVVDEGYERRHPDAKAGPYVLLAVTDTGHGMDRETQRRVFEPFFTTKEPGKGTGLGLSTVYGIVQQSGGFLWLYSEVGHGTTFKVYLPALPDAELTAAESSQGARGSAVRAELGSETVLLVEDEALLRWVVRDVLEHQGYRVIEATCGDAAEQMLRDASVPIDLLLTDIVLPGPSGTVVARTAEQLRAGLRVLYMSGYTEDAIIRHGDLPPGTMFLEKPFSASALLQRVRAVLDAPPTAPG